MIGTEAFCGQIFIIYYLRVLIYRNESLLTLYTHKRYIIKLYE